MLTVNREHSVLLVVDFQTRLMPRRSRTARQSFATPRRLLDAARLFKMPVLFTEENAKGLGGTLPELLSGVRSHRR